jgi:hypothetical protein
MEETEYMELLFLPYRAEVRMASQATMKEKRKVQIASGELVKPEEHSEGKEVEDSEARWLDETLREK